MSNQTISGRGVNIMTGTTVIGEVQNVSEMMATLSKIDTTSHNNVSAVRTSRPGFIENSEITVECGYYAQAAQDAINTAFYAGTVSTWTVVAPTHADGVARAWQFQGYVSGCSIPTFDKEGGAKLTFRVQPSGTVTTLSTALTGMTAMAVTDQGSTALTLSPTFAATTYAYQVTTASDDTGVKVTITYAGSGEAGYVNNSSLATETASSAITIGTSSGSVIMIPVMFYKAACVPKITWLEVTHGY